MKVHVHESPLTTTPGGSGHDLGRTWADEIACATTRYADFFATLGIPQSTVHEIALGCHEALRGWAPHLAVEVEAISAGSGLSLERVAMIGARTEILAMAQLPPVECTTLACEQPGRAFGFQTWDWIAPLVPDALVWSYAAESGQRVATFTEPGILAKIGVNDAGLAVHFNLLTHERDSRVDPGVPVHAVARRILDEARSLEDAIAIVGSARASASSVFTVVATSPDTAPRAAAIELSPAGSAVVSADPQGWVVHANQFLNPGLAEGEVTDPDATSPARLAHLDSVAADDLAGLDFVELGAAVCGGLGSTAPICVAPDESLPVDQQWETLLSIRTDPVAGRLDWAPHSPDRASEGTAAYSLR